MTDQRRGLDSLAGPITFALLILIAFWDDHRLLAAALIALLFSALAVVAGIAAWRQIVAKPRPFDASLNELAKDEEELRARR